ncbi:MAG: radical SAM protein [Planctomycetota bacterium]
MSKTSEAPSPSEPATKGKVVFVNPPYERIAPGYDFLRHVTNRAPSLGLLHLAAMVREHGWTPAIVEGDVEGLDEEGVVQAVLRERPDYVGITLFTVGVWSAAKIARRLKRELPGLTIIVGGPHVSSMGRETLERFFEFDVAADGEAEWILVHLLEALRTGTDLEAVDGLLIRTDEGVVATNKAQALDELDSLPLPAWDLLEGFPGAFRPAIFDFPRGPVATIAASRGCPFHCRFCDTSTFGARLRAYTPAGVVGLMRHLSERYGVRHIMFVDDLFLASRQRVMEFCDRLEESGLGMTWTCTARVDTVKPDILARMREVGCWEISFGLETGSDALLKAMDKVASVAKSELAVGWTAAAGIRTKGLFMLGYPGETLATIEETKAFARRIPMDMMNLTKFTPYPGSPIYRDLYGTNIRADHWEKMNGMNFLWAPEGLTDNELDAHYQEILRHFYRQPRVLRHYLALSLRHPGHVGRLVCFGFGVLRAKLRGVFRGRGPALIPESSPQL